MQEKSGRIMKVIKFNNENGVKKHVWVAHTYTQLNFTIYVFYSIATYIIYMYNT